MIVTTRHLGQLAAALDHRDSQGGLDEGELQLYTAYTLLADEAGRSTATSAELFALLGVRRSGHEHAARKAISAARMGLKSRGLIACTRSASSRINPRTGALLDTPWEITLSAVRVRPFAWAGTSEWLGRLLADVSRRPITRKVGLKLARALDASGQLGPVTRKDLADLLDVHRDVAIRELRQLGELGFSVELREDRSVRPALCAVSVRNVLAAEVRPAAIVATAPTPGTSRPALSRRGVVPAGLCVELDVPSNIAAVELDEAMRTLWYRAPVERAIKRGEANLPAGTKLSNQQKFDEYVRPVLDLQENVPAPLLKGALVETNSRNWNIYALYLRKVIANRAAVHAHAPKGTPKTNGQVASEERALVLGRAHKLLADAARLNGRGETELARPLLTELLAIAPAYAAVEGEDEQKVLRHFQIAFKCGSRDPFCLWHRRYGWDYLPEWDPDEQEPSAARNASPAALTAIRITAEAGQVNDADWLGELARICDAHPGVVPLWLAPPHGEETPFTIGAAQVRVSATAGFAAAIAALKQRPAATASATQS
jgi:hypothetical protein